MLSLAERQADALFARAAAILDDHAPDWGEPILRHLALRGHAWGMSEVARRFGRPGKAADSWSATGLNRRAWRIGNATAAYNEAMHASTRATLPATGSGLGERRALETATRPPSSCGSRYGFHTARRETSCGTARRCRTMGSGRPSG